MTRLLYSVLLAAVTLATASCGHSKPPVDKRTVFDPGSAPTGGPEGSRDWEQPMPALDRAVGAKHAPFTGVSVLRGGVRFSRPARWMIRDGSAAPGQSYIRYVSPDAYSFALYERIDSAGDSWKVIQQRYEDDVSAAGAKAVGRNVPMATGFNQGRAYTIERAQPAPSRSREIIVKSENRVVLVQIVSQGADLSRLSADLLEVLDHLEVL